MEGDVAPHPMKKRSGNDEFYANACDYCNYKGLCGLDADNKELCRIPMTEKETLAAMQAIMDGEEEKQ